MNIYLGKNVRQPIISQIKLWKHFKLHTWNDDYSKTFLHHADVLIIDTSHARGSMVLKQLKLFKTHKILLIVCTKHSEAHSYRTLNKDKDVAKIVLRLEYVENPRDIMSHIMVSIARHHVWLQIK